MFRPEVAAADPYTDFGVALRRSNKPLYPKRPLLLSKGSSAHVGLNAISIYKIKTLRKQTPCLFPSLYALGGSQLVTFLQEAHCNKAADRSCQNLKAK
eukprot:1859549-Amphidinium_carterae.1